jgi:hypothetical protein
VNVVTPDQEEALVPEDVTEPAGGDQQHREHQQVGVDDPQDLVVRGVDAADRDGDGDDAAVQQRHEEADAENAEHQPWPFRGHHRTPFQDVCDSHLFVPSDTRKLIGEARGPR